MKYKMIVADFDDTLLNSQRTYSQRIKNIIKKYVDKGGKFVIATGRMTAAVLPYCRDLGLKGEVITYQGALSPISKAERFWSKRILVILTLINLLYI